MIKFQVNAEAVKAKFTELGTNSPTTLRALDAFARVLRTRIQLAFRSQKSPYGTTWAPLKYRTGQALRNTGRLYGSIQVRRDGDGVVVGTNLKVPNGPQSLGAVHQFGAVIKPKKGPFLVFAIPGRKGLVFARQVTIPARPFMPITPQNQTILPPAWEKAALNAMGRALGLGSGGSGVPA